MNPRSVIRSAAQRDTEARRRLREAVVAAYGTMPVTDIADAAGVTRMTVYVWLAEAGVELKQRTQRVK